MTPNEVSNIIFDTECRNFLSDGLSCSQPILSIGAKGLIDNFFVYSINRKTGEISAPKVVFGIYADRKEVAYINETPLIQDGSQKAASVGGTNYYSLIEKYGKLYSTIRPLAFRVCNHNDAQIVAEYCDTLEKISGTVLWEYYNQLFPDFFEWAKKYNLS